MEYIPGAPVNDEVKKANQNLPGMGGVFNVVNFHLYHYAGNNPVKYMDPDGNWFKSPAKMKMNKGDWATKEVLGSTSKMNLTGCLITAIANAISSFSGKSKTPLDLNSDSYKAETGVLNTEKAATDSDLKYSAINKNSDTNIKKELQKLNKSSTGYAVIVDAFYAADGSTTYAGGGNKTHSVNVIGLVSGPTGDFVRAEGTSTNDLEPEARRNSWVIDKNTNTVLIPIKDIVKVRVLEEK